MPMGLYDDGVLLSIQICSIGQWGNILVIVMGCVDTFELYLKLCKYVITGLPFSKKANRVYVVLVVAW